jgi:hypothetical protein
MSKIVHYDEFPNIPIGTKIQWIDLQGRKINPFINSKGNIVHFACDECIDYAIGFWVLGPLDYVEIVEQSLQQ